MVSKISFGTSHGLEEYTFSDKQLVFIKQFPWERQSHEPSALLMALLHHVELEKQFAERSLLL